MTKDDVARWALTHPLAPIHVDCATAVMLKILDGKCKMRTEEKRVMELLYDEVKTQPSHSSGAGFATPLLTFERCQALHLSNISASNKATQEMFTLVKAPASRTEFSSWRDCESIIAHHTFTRSHALRGNAVWDALRPVFVRPIFFQHINHDSRRSAP